MRNVKVMAVLMAVFFSARGIGTAQNILTTTNHTFSETNRFESAATHTVFTAIAANTNSGFEPYIFSFQLGYNIETTSASGTGAWHFAHNNIQSANEGIWWPLRFKCVRLGLGGTISLNFDIQYAFEFNALPGIYVEYFPFKRFLLSYHVNYLFKGRRIFAISDYEPFLINHSAAMGIRFHLFPGNGFSLYAGADSTELFRYSIFVAPTFTTGIMYSYERFSFLFELNARYIDFFTLSSAYEGTEIRFLMGWRL